MAYELILDLPEPPDRAQVEAWATGRGFEAVHGDDGFLVRDGLHFLASTDGPQPTPDGRWSVVARSFSEELVQELAQALGGSVADSVWMGPRSRPAAKITLTWFIAPSRWAPAQLLPLLGAHCPEALPADYEQFGVAGKGWMKGTDAEVAWDTPGYAEVFHFSPEDAAELGTDSITHEAHDVGRLVVILPLSSADRAVALFEAAGPKLGAFFAAAERSEDPEHFLQGARWQGLPPIPMWHAWFGPPYLELVEAHLDGERFREGLLVREPRTWSLPPELTYTARPPEPHPHGGVLLVPAQPGDEASEIPPLG